MASILFVDDEPLTLKLLTQAAEILGHKGHTASTEEQALKMANDLHPDLIVTDINLNGHRSLGMIEHLHFAAETKSIPIVTLSALDQRQIRDEARTRGAVASLEKPIRLQALLEVINEYAPKK